MASQLIAASILGALFFLPWLLILRLRRAIGTRRRRPQRLVWPI